MKSILRLEGAKVFFAFLAIFISSEFASAQSRDCVIINGQRVCNVQPLPPVNPPPGHTPPPHYPPPGHTPPPHYPPPGNTPPPYYPPPGNTPPPYYPPPGNTPPPYYPPPYGGCINTYEVVPGIICQGSQVFLRNSSGEPRVGTVTYISGNQVSVTYQYNGTNNVSRWYTEVSPAVQSLGGFVIGDQVVLRNSAGELRDGRVDALFGNGQVGISYYYNGTNNVFRDYRDIQKNYGNVYGYYVGQTVHLRNSSGEDRIGQILLLTAATAKVRYDYNGLNEVYRNLSDISGEVSCLGAICRGTSVNLQNNSGQLRTGRVLNVFANGRVYISYEYNGTNFVWREARDVYPGPYYP